MALLNGESRTEEADGPSNPSLFYIFSQISTLGRVSGVGSGPNPNTETWVVLTPEGEERLGNCRHTHEMVRLLWRRFTGIHDDQRVGDHRLAPVSHVHDFCRARPPLTIKGLLDYHHSRSHEFVSLRPPLSVRWPTKLLTICILIDAIS